MSDRNWGSLPAPTRRRLISVAYGALGLSVLWMLYWWGYLGPSEVHQQSKPTERHCEQTQSADHNAPKVSQRTVVIVCFDEGAGDHGTQAANQNQDAPKAIKPLSRMVARRIISDPIALFTVFLAIFTWRLIVVGRDQHQAAMDAIDVAKVNAGVASLNGKTAEQAVRLAGDTAKRQLRAYLYVMNNATPEFNGEGVLEGHFLLKNAGQTPALRVRTANAMSIGKLPFEGDPPPIDASILKGGAPLAPGAVFRLICRIPEPPPENWREALRKRTRAVCMYGEIRYLDVFGDEHVTTYRAMYSGPIADGIDEIIWCENGNEAT
jgi:hypothetical protein